MFLSKHFIFANDHIYFFYNLAMKAYEDHCRRNGQNVSHPFMKELLAGFAAAEADKLFETHGLDFLDRERAKRHAIQQAHHLAEQQYGPGGVFNYQANQYGNYPPNFQQQGGYGMDPYNGGNYPPQGGYGMNPYNNGNYPLQGGYPMNPYNNGSYPPQGGYAMNPYNDPNYQQQGNKHHHHHHHHIF